MSGYQFHLMMAGYMRLVYIFYVYHDLTGLPESLSLLFVPPKTLPVTICHLSVNLVSFCTYFKFSSFLASFVEILFLRGPMALKYDR